MSIYLKIDGLDGNEVLWRYMDFAKFASMLEQKAIWLARVDTVRDKHEGRFPIEMRKYIESAYQGFDGSGGSLIKNADDFQDYLIKNTFISCWHRISKKI